MFRIGGRRSGKTTDLVDELIRMYRLEGELPIVMVSSIQRSAHVKQMIEDKVGRKIADEVTFITPDTIVRGRKEPVLIDDLEAILSRYGNVTMATATGDVLVRGADAR